MSQSCATVVAMVTVARLWGAAELQCETELCGLLVDDVVHEESAVRQAAAQGLAAAVKIHPGQIDTMLQLLLSNYSEQLYVSTGVLTALCKYRCTGSH